MRRVLTPMRRFLRLPRTQGVRVLEANGSAVRVEGEDDLASVGSLERVAVLAHWATTARLSRSVTTTVSALAGAGYRVVIVSTSDDPAPLDWPDDRPNGVTVIRRPNLGYDFGSWATALDRYPVILEAQRVLLVNDSLAGPFATIEHLLARFHASSADAWAVTDTSQFGYHLQSYILGFPGHTLREPRSAVSGETSGSNGPRTT